MQYARLIQASLDLERELAARDKPKTDLYDRAAALAEAGSIAEAAATYRELLALDADDAAAWRELSLLYIAQERAAEASAALLRALALDPNQPRCHYEFGKAARQMQPSKSALLTYVQQLGVGSTVSHTTDVGTCDLLEDAEAQCQSACAQSADAPEPFVTLGHILLARGQVAHSIEAYTAACCLMPDDIALVEMLAEALHLNGEHGRASLLLGRAYYRERRYAEVIPLHRDVLALRRDTSQIHAELAHALNHEKLYVEAIETCLTGTLKYPDEPDLYDEWVYALLEVNRTEDAASMAVLAATRFPDHVSLAHQAALALPVVHRDTHDIEQWRQRFTAGMQRICRETRLDGMADAQKALKAISSPFYLAYQGMSDRDLMQQYGDLAQRVMRANYPAYAVPRAMPALPADGRLRVGYISASLRWPGVGEIFLDWLARRNPREFETYVYNLGRSSNLVARQFELTSDHYRWVPLDVPDAAEQVLVDDLHILVYLEIGMQPFMTRLAALRLAPIQCAALGHPLTTGLPTLDYFLSAEYAEPENGQDHYTEQLITLPNIGICPRRPYPPAQGLTRAQLGIAEAAVVYFSPQNVSKYLPQHDDLYPIIAQRVPGAQFIFMPHTRPECLTLFRNRLLNAFARHGLDGERYIHILPSVDYPEYLGIHRMVDVFLDTIGWSGGMSTLDALGCAVPVVTCPGALMRGRQSYAYLQQLGIYDTVARDVNHYVDIAVRIGMDADWRQDMRAKIAARLDRLYDTAERVSELERFYQRVAQERLQKEKL